MRKVTLITSIFAIAFIYACKKSSIKTYDCSSTTSTYTNNVKAIMDASCATSGCHSASKKAAGIDLSSFEATKNYSSNSKFMKSIQHVSGAEAMPKGGSKLSESDIQLIYCWANNGTPQ
jgi:hypothetical protein